MDEKSLNPCIRLNAVVSWSRAAAIEPWSDPADRLSVFKTRHMKDGHANTQIPFTGRLQCKLETIAMHIDLDLLVQEALVANFAQCTTSRDVWSRLQAC